MNKEECISILRFSLISRKLFLSEHLKDENSGQECQSQLDRIDEAMKYLEDNLK